MSSIDNGLTILGLDPGEQTGYCYLSVRNGRPVLGTYGVIPVVEPGRLGLLRSVEEFIRGVDARPDDVEIAMSEIIHIPRRPTSHSALEVQGVLRLWSAVGYKPASIHSMLGTRRKTDVAVLIERLFGVRVRPDHAADACAAALVHGMTIGVISKLDLSPIGKPGGLRGPRGKQVPERPTDDDLREMIRTGQAVPVRRI